jgi:hypothetical protein
MLLIAGFACRKNDDKTMDLICTSCYRTVVCTTDEAALERAEQSHRCDDEDVWNARYTDSQRGTF